MDASGVIRNYVPDDTNRKQDRIVLLKQIDGTKPISSSGLVDPRLFTGEVKLHVRIDETSLWYLKYDIGALPPTLRDKKFTSFKKAMEAVSNYFNSRNIQIKEVLD